MARQGAGNDVEQENSDLAGLARADLVERWQGLYGVDPPKGISTRLMLRAVAYEMQVRRYGGLSRLLKRKITEISQSTSDDAIGGPPSLTIGTRLVREWQGRVHVVDVMEKGFAWDGRVYSSLSKIAREITGTRWSGPRFFGLKSKRGRAA
jgi:hypothetical protein